MEKVGIIAGKFRLLHLGHKEAIIRATNEPIKKLYIIITDNPTYKRYSSISELKIALGKIMQNIDIDYELLIYKNKTEKITDFENFIINKISINNNIKVDDIIIYNTKEDYQNIKLKNKFLKCNVGSNVSVSKIEKNPFKGENYYYIAKEFKCFMNKKIIISGVESSGKTQMCKKLGSVLQTDYSPEVGKTYCKTYLGGVDEAFMPKDFIFIAINQLQQDKEVNINANKAVIIDTDPIVTMRFLESYYIHYAQNDMLTPEFETDYQNAFNILDNICKSYKSDLTILLTPINDFIADGQRWDMAQEERELTYQHLKSLYDRYEINYTEINQKEYQKRLKLVEQEVLKLYKI